MRDNRLGLFSGMGMVIANMIGAGVFLSTGFMAQELNPSQILLAWIVGAFLALAGAQVYSTIARAVPHSGGEYRYLSTLIHPSLGYLAGWVSLLLGFSAPIAIDAAAAGAFAKTLSQSVDPRLFAAAMIILLTAVHAIGLRFSVAAQNSLVVIKILLVVGFMAIGLIGGRNAWPAWHPPVASSGFPLAPFMQNLFYIAFAFSGWNAAVYASSEFKNPKRDVPRAMIIGCAIVGVLYLLVNWVFVANLTPEQCKVVFTYESERVTLGHLIMKNVVGDFATCCMSILAIMAFISAASAMTFLGPRVYAAMARDGFLPRILQGKEGKPPIGAVMLQGGIALFIVLRYQLQTILNNVGAILTVFSALTVFSLFWIRFKRRDLEQPGFGSLAAAFCYLLLSGLMLYFGSKTLYKEFAKSPSLLAWSIGIMVMIVAGYFIARKKAIVNPPITTQDADI